MFSIHIENVHIHLGGEDQSNFKNKLRSSIEPKKEPIRLDYTESELEDLRENDEDAFIRWVDEYTRQCNN